MNGPSWRENYPGIRRVSGTGQRDRGRDPLDFMALKRGEQERSLQVLMKTRNYKMAERKPAGGAVPGDRHFRFSRVWPY